MKNRSIMFTGLLVFLLTLSVRGSALSGETEYVAPAGSDSQNAAAAGWQEKFKDQVAREDAAEGHAGHEDQVNAAMQKLMDEISKGTNEHAAHTGGSGPFSDMATMQQMDRSFFLGPAPAGESVTLGGHCPANAPVKEYDVSAINAEITINQWLDYFPGYMYVLTENVEKVRAEEKANTEARKKPGYDPGAVTTGLQTDMIQPLNIRANQGDCLILPSAIK